MTDSSWAAMPLNLADRIKTSKRIPKWLRFPLLLVAVFLMIPVLGVICGLCILAIAYDDIYSLEEK